MDEREDHMDRNDKLDNATASYDRAYFAKMREIAGRAGSAHVWHGYLLAADHPEVHFGALCAAGLGLRLSEDHYTEGCDDLWLLAGAWRERAMSGLSGRLFLCPDCLGETERVLREMSKAAAWEEEYATDMEFSTFYWGDEEEVDRIRRELTRMHAPRKPHLRLV
jgi:hypothetical protein